MLKRIHIRGYKSLEDVEVRLSQLVVLFGPNAAGKSNLLDALQLLSKLGTSRTLKEAFDPPYRGKPLESFTIGQKGIKGLLEQERLSFSIEVDLILSDAVVKSVNRQILEMRRPHGAVESKERSKFPARVAVGGHGKVTAELNYYMRDLKRQGRPYPDLIVVATDANCKGLNERTREIVCRDDPAPMILAIPDPHLERWLLLDGAAFKAVFGKGCDAPDQKCDF